MKPSIQEIHINLTTHCFFLPSTGKGHNHFVLKHLTSADHESINQGPFLTSQANTLWHLYVFLCCFASSRKSPCGHLWVSPLGSFEVKNGPSGVLFPKKNICFGFEVDDAPVVSFEPTPRPCQRVLRFGNSEMKKCGALLGSSGVSRGQLALGGSVLSGPFDFCFLGGWQFQRYPVNCNTLGGVPDFGPWLRGTWF